MHLRFLQSYSSYATIMSTARVSIPSSIHESHQSTRSCPPTGNGDVQSRLSPSNIITPTTWCKPEWEAKIASFQRGLIHVTQCPSTTSCGSSLCLSTRRLMRTYATHYCEKNEGGNREEERRLGDCNNRKENKCKVCKLMLFLMSPKDIRRRDNQHIDFRSIPNTINRTSRVPPLPVRRTRRLSRVHTMSSIHAINSTKQRF